MRSLRIRNKGKLARLLLELVGHSTKGDEDAGKVGFKGSGKKLAAIAGERMGLGTAIASSDAQGDYFLRVTSTPVQVGALEVRRIDYLYYGLDAQGRVVVTRRFETPFVTSGFAGWSDPIGDDDNPAFKVVREHVSDAFDEDSDFSADLVDAAEVGFAPDGETCVFLKATPDVLRIFKWPERYFKFLSRRPALARVGGIGEVWEKSVPSQTRLFVRRVFVHCSKADRLRSIYDYSLINRDLLSEERLLVSERSFEWVLGRMLLRLEDEEVLLTLAEGLRERSACLELRALDTLGLEDVAAHAGRIRWLHALEKAFDTTLLAVASDDDEHNTYAQVNHGRTVVGRGDRPLREFLAKLGVPSADDIVPHRPQDRVIQIGPEELTSDEWWIFHDAHRLFAKRLARYVARWPIAFFRPREGSEGSPYGFAMLGEDGIWQIWLNVERFVTVQSVFETIVHEIIHCVLGHPGHDDRFIKRLERELSLIVYQAEGLTPDDLDPASPIGDPEAQPFFLPIDRTSIGERDTLLDLPNLPVPDDKD